MAEPAWMLDTNTLSDLIRNPRGSLVQRLSSTEPDSVCTSIVVACELRFGAKRKGSDALTKRVEQLLASLTVIPLDEPADRLVAERDFSFSNSISSDFRFAGMGLACFAWPARTDTRLDYSHCVGSEARRRRVVQPGSRYRALSHRHARSAPSRCSRRQ